MESSKNSVRHRACSPARVWAIAKNTLTQLIRMRAFYFLLILSLLVLGGAVLIENFTGDPTRQLKIVKDMTFFAMSIFCTIFAIVATANLIPSDIEDRTLYTILAKPVPRFEYLIGKYLGSMLVIVVSLVVMTILLYGILYLRQTIILTLEEQAFKAGAYTLEEFEDQRRKIQLRGVSWTILNGVAAIGLQAAVLGAITLCVSTFATSGLFTVIVTFIIFFVGSIQPIAIEFWRNRNEELSAGTNYLLRLFETVFPNFQSFNIVDGIISGEAVPSALMLKILLIAVAYVFAYLFAAYLVFAKKEL